MSYPRLAPVLAVIVAASAGPASATNWLMLQGTENPKAPEHRIFAFIQPTYTKNLADPMTGIGAPLTANNDKVVGQNLVPPKFEDREAFHVMRARGGVRGKLGDKFNYFVLAEVAPNNMTYDPFGDRARAIALDHLSITANYIPGARVRAGLFKNPGSEETFGGIALFDYIDFTGFSAREILERFVTGVKRPAASAQGDIGTPVTKAYGFNAARDWGVQVFDSFKQNNWDLSYAVKVGRGEAISTTDDNEFNPELYLYGSAEYALPGGKGPRKNGVKLYAWRQQGKRDFASDPSGKDYKRVRQGVGFKAVGKLFGSNYKHRLSGELMQASGVVFLGPAGGVPGPGRPIQLALDDDNKALGWYLDYGFYLDKNWQFDVRYDKTKLLYDTSSDVDPGNEREITGLTLGVNYHFTPKLRLTANFTHREAEAPTDYPNPGLTKAVRQTVANLDDRVALQLTWIY